MLRVCGTDWSWLVAKAPSPNGPNGERDSNGRFAKGNLGGPGNPHAKQVARVRSLILEAVTEKDLSAIVATLVKRAKDGDIIAARELFDRLVGKPATAIDPERRELEEQRLELRGREVDAKEDQAWLGD